MKYLPLLLLLTSCGAKYKEHHAFTPSAKWLELASSVKEDCVGCHDGVKHRPDLRDERNFNNHEVQEMLETKKMPPKEKLADEEYEKLLSYF